MDSRESIETDIHMASVPSPSRMETVMKVDGYRGRELVLENTFILMAHDMKERFKRVICTAEVS